MENIILVDKTDNIVGYQDKLTAHLGKGVLHRAYTILIFNSKGEILLQQRAKAKMLWPLFWEASCSSHQKPAERSDAQAITNAQKRLFFEMGFSCPLRLIGKFQYHELYKNIGAEYELCWLLVGEYNGVVKPNPDEVADYQWITPAKLQQELTTPRELQTFAPWLIPALSMFGGRSSKH